MKIYFYYNKLCYTLVFIKIKKRLTFLLMFCYFCFFQNVDHKVKFRSKKGQLPFIELNGEEIADSTIILRELGQKYGKDIDACLTPDQKNTSHATTSMIENHLVWVVACWRTKNLDQMIKGYKINLQHTLGTRIIPNPVLNFFFKFTFGRKVRNTTQSAVFYFLFLL